MVADSGFYITLSTRILISPGLLVANPGLQTSVRGGSWGVLELHVCIILVFIHVPACLSCLMTSIRC